MYYEKYKIIIEHRYLETMEIRLKNNNDNGIIIIYKLINNKYGLSDV